MKENFIIGLKNRILQQLARFLPGSTSIRVYLNRWRGVKIGKGVFIGYDSIIETSCPHLVSIGNEVGIILAHHRELAKREKGSISVRIEDKVYIGPGSVILPAVTIGYGAVVTAGSVVNQSIPPMTVVQGNPAKPIAKCGVPLTNEVPIREFRRKLKPIKKKYGYR